MKKISSAWVKVAAMLLRHKYSLRDENFFNPLFFRARSPGGALSRFTDREVRPGCLNHDPV